MSDIVFYGVNDWRAIKQRPQHIAERLAATHRVLYLNPIGYSVLTHVVRGLRRSTRRGWRPQLESIAERLWLFTPSPVLPFSRRMRVLNRLNHRLLAIQVQPILARLEMREPIAWIAFPTGVDLIGRLNERSVVVDYLDDYPSFFSGREQAIIAAMEHGLIERADLVLATAQLLFEKCHQINSKTYLMPNGVDVAHFARARERLPEPGEVRGLPHPRFGYMGTISHWTDVDTLLALARTVPTGSVIVIGPWEVPAPADVPANFHALGSRPYNRLPDYLSNLDVALIPFKTGPLTHAVNPVKLFEYAAAGLPIVATTTYELARYADWCTLADTPDAFVNAAVRLAGEAARGENRAQIERAINAARQHDWQSRTDAINQLLQRL